MKVRSKSVKESSDNKCGQLMLPDVSSMSSSGSIYRVVKNCHYNVCNAPIQLPHPKVQRSRGHYSLSIFRTIFVPDQSRLGTCLLLGQLHSEGPLATCDSQNDISIPLGPSIRWILTGPPAELELHR
jgi:hypothetical protein